MPLRSEPGGAKAEGLLRRMHTQRFVGTVYILTEILPILAELSRIFQRNFNSVQPRQAQEHCSTYCNSKSERRWNSFEVGSWK